MKKTTTKVLSLLLTLALFFMFAPVSFAEDTEGPLPVENVKVTEEGDGFVSLSWDATIDEHGEVDYYEVLYDDEPAEPTKRYQDYELKVQTENTEITIEDLENGQTYYFSLVAFDDSGNMTPYFSEEIAGTPKLEIDVEEDIKDENEEEIKEEEEEKVEIQKVDEVNPGELEIEQKEDRLVLSWPAVSSDVIKQDLYTSTDGGNTYEDVGVGLVNQYSVREYKKDTLYTFKLTETTQDGEETKYIKHFFTGEEEDDDKNDVPDELPKSGPIALGAVVLAGIAGLYMTKRKK